LVLSQESKLVKKTRDIMVLPAKIFFPMSVPVFAVMLDSMGDAMALHSHYLDLKVCL
jgi:hypothetical protein